jgi:predicted nucleic acid-binding protein
VPPPEIIVDPNLWVSALISPGSTTAGVLRAVLSDEVTAIVTPHLLEELSADDYLVALAEETGAVIVTGDDDLLSLNLTPPAITPRALLDLLESLAGSVMNKSHPGYAVNRS